MKKKQKRRKTKNSKANSLLYFAVVLIIVAILLYFEIKNMTSVMAKGQNEDKLEFVIDITFIFPDVDLFYSCWTVIKDNLIVHVILFIVID